LDCHTPTGLSPSKRTVVGTAVVEAGGACTPTNFVEIIPVGSVHAVALGEACRCPCSVASFLIRKASDPELCAVWNTVCKGRILTHGNQQGFSVDSGVKSESALFTQPIAEHRERSISLPECGTVGDAEGRDADRA
jgi:hypothetical protein